MSFSVLLQRAAPLRAMTRLAGRVAGCRHPWVAQPLIRAFVRRYGVDLAEAERSQPSLYRSFNDLFSRTLRQGARPQACSDWTSPADGVVSQLGHLTAGQLLQVKQRAYSASELLGDATLAHQLEGALFTSVYLSPGDYHRVHMPCDGRLLGMRYIPGSLFSVRPEIVRSMDGLLARNERLVCWFAHPRHGVFAMVLVGAAIVGSITTVWHDQPVCTQGPSGRLGAEGCARTASSALRQGDEMGGFLLGSTVVLLIPQGFSEFVPSWQLGQRVRVGQALARGTDEADGSWGVGV